MALNVARFALIGLVALFTEHTCRKSSNDFDTTSKSAVGVEHQSSFDEASKKTRKKKLDTVLSLLQNLYSQVNTLEKRIKEIEKQQSEIDLSLLCSKTSMYATFYQLTKSKLLARLSTTLNISVSVSLLLRQMCYHNRLKSRFVKLFPMR